MQIWIWVSRKMRWNWWALVGWEQTSGQIQWLWKTADTSLWPPQAPNTHKQTNKWTNKYLGLNLAGAQAWGERPAAVDVACSSVVECFVTCGFCPQHHVENNTTICQIVSADGDSSWGLNRFNWNRAKQGRVFEHQNFKRFFFFLNVHYWYHLFQCIQTWCQVSENGSQAPLKRL